MEIRDYLESKISNRLKADGGWIDFVSLDGENLVLQFQGECSKCQILDRCVDWIKQEIKADLDIDVTIRVIRKKPYFQDI